MPGKSISPFPNRTNPLAHPRPKGSPGCATPPTRRPRWPTFLSLRQAPLARILVRSQHLLLGSFLSSPRPLTSRLRCRPSPVLSWWGRPPSPLPSPCLLSLVPDPVLWRRPLRPHQRPSLQDGCTLETGPKVGYELLQDYPPPNPVHQVVSPPSTRPFLP